jgi:hypothetical protein
MTEALHRHDFDTVLMALNAAQSANPVAIRKMVAIPSFEQSTLPLALQKNMGILSMKVMGQGMLGRKRRRPSIAIGTFTVQPEPACRMCRHRLREDGPTRTKRPSCPKFHPDERKRQAEATRKSRTFAFSMAAVSAGAR